jgi:hypothetical protein
MTMPRLEPQRTIDLESDNLDDGPCNSTVTNPIPAADSMNALTEKLRACGNCLEG